MVKLGPPALPGLCVMREASLMSSIDKGHQSPHQSISKQSSDHLCRVAHQQLIRLLGGSCDLPQRETEPAFSIHLCQLTI